MITAILKFEIINTFAEWEQAFYSHQPVARAAGIFELYHGHALDNDQSVVVVLNCFSEEHMKKFVEATEMQWLLLVIFLSPQPQSYLPTRFC